MLNYRVYKNIVLANLTLLFVLALFCHAVFAALVANDPMMSQAVESAQEDKQDQDMEGFKRPHIEYNASNLRDPFEDLLARKREEEARKKEAEPTIEINVPPPPLTVQGLVWGGTTPQAIINNKVVKKGDVIEEAEIVDIGKDGVNVLYKNHLFRLSSPASNYRSADKKEVIK